MGLLGELLVIVVLTALEAVFVASEIALITIRRTRVEQLVEEGSSSARRVQRLIARPGRFLAVIQIGVTFIGFLASAFAAVTLTEQLKGLLVQAPALAGSAGIVALVIVTLLLSLFTIVFGELVPKSLALAHTERYALALSGVIDLLLGPLGPLVWLLTRLTDSITRALGVHGVPSPATISTEELRLLVERGGEQGILEAEEEQMISAVMELGEGRVHEVMVPRIDIAAIPAETDLATAVGIIIKEGHSRIPVYEGSVDEVIGILYAKDLLPYLNGTVPPADLRKILRQPLFVPESMGVDDLLHELQRRKVHIAIVLDEYGGTAGLVTIEDLLEEIVGEIQDEYDTEEPMVERLSDDEARIDGRADVDDLTELFDLRLDHEEEEEYDTVGGLVYHHIGGVPKVGDTVKLDGLTLTVESTDGRRVGKVLAVRERRSGDDDAEERSPSSDR
ncbi:MAG: HlyC/CorC family transporter [Chloroflexota bacterium]|nr:MAG: HlyC/CorC family transporter [Chloroflexota bacterium]